MKHSRRALAVIAAGSVAGAPLCLALLSPTAQAKPFDPKNMPKIQHRLLSGALANLVEAGDDRNADAQASARPRNYFPTDTNGCPVQRGSNTKVNQNCVNLTDPDLQGRGQAQNETSIAQDALHPANLVSSYNDYRRGDGNCYAAYSRDGGKSWDDSTVPMSFTRGTAFGNNARQYWQAGGDTSVAFDTRGNAYLSCQVFNRGANGLTSNPDVSSAFYVYRSTHNSGASWNFPGRPVAEANDVAATGAVFEDKQLLTVDNHKSSPYRDRVYVTWTEFTGEGTAYIYASYSADYGETFSKRVLVSKTSPMCGNTYGVPTPKGKCNENQFSQPFTGSDGTLYVTWANYNNVVKGSDNHNQMLLTKSTDGGRSFSSPIRVGDYYDLPDCATYQGGQNLGRSCVPEKAKTTKSVFRATNYPSGAVDPTDPKRVVVTYGSYINQHSKESNGCTPKGLSPRTGANRYVGVKTPGACNNDILISVSTNKGGSFTGTTANPRAMDTVNGSAAQNTTDQWFQWTAFGPSGTFATSYYDRQYGNDERTGFSDFSVSGSRDLASYKVTRATSSSMPPPTQFDGTFWGDYTGLAVGAHKAYPLWSDTRDPELFLCPTSGTTSAPPRTCTATEANGLRANDQNAYTAGILNFTP